MSSECPQLVPGTTGRHVIIAVRSVASRQRWARARPAPSWENLFRRIGPSDVILTFNWDVILEELMVHAIGSIFIAFDDAHFHPATRKPIRTRRNPAAFASASRSSSHCDAAVAVSTPSAVHCRASPSKSTRARATPNSVKGKGTILVSTSLRPAARKSPGNCRPIQGLRRFRWKVERIAEVVARSRDRWPPFRDRRRIPSPALPVSPRGPFPIRPRRAIPHAATRARPCRHRTCCHPSVGAGHRPRQTPPASQDAPSTLGLRRHRLAGIQAHRKSRAAHKFGQPAGVVPGAAADIEDMLPFAQPQHFITAFLAFPQYRRRLVQKRNKGLRFSVASTLPNCVVSCL